MRIRYSMDYYKLEDAFELEVHDIYAGDEEAIAQECAEDFHYQHDGWECTWPITFILWDQHDNEIGRFEVERESVPHFIAGKVKPKEPK